MIECDLNTSDSGNLKPGTNLRGQPPLRAA
jgi:hypothetical protein